MKVKDVLKNACKFIGLEELKNVFESGQISPEDQETVDKLVEIFNFVQEEVATEFLNILQYEKVSASKELYFSDLSKTILDVKYIKNIDGKRVSFTLFPDHISFKDSIVEIVYSYIPDIVGLEDEILYLIPLRVYAYAIAREFFLFEGLVDKATLFENRFKNSISSLLRKDKTKNMPAKKWL